MADAAEPCTPPPCGPSPGNAPVSDEQFMCSMGSQLQAQVDAGRRMVHTLGLRPYRVRLVWQQRDRVKNAWEEVDHLELMPVKVNARDSALEITEAGVAYNGPITLSEVSPQQVTELQLRGWRNGENWPDKGSEREFFIELQAMRRCPTDPEMPRHRYTLGSQIHRDGENFQMVFSLVPQIVERAPNGKDMSIVPPAKGKPKLKL